MKHILLYIYCNVILFSIASCQTKSQRRLNPETAKPIRIEIINKSHRLNFSDIDTSKKLTTAQTFQIGIDTLNRAFSQEFYYASDEKLLKTNPVGLDILIYYKVYYGEEQRDKILVVKKANKIVSNIILAASGENESIGTFTNGNIFTLTTITKENIRDSQYSQIDSVDSTQTFYKYDDNLIFKEVDKKSFKYYTRKGNSELDGKEFKVYGKPFSLNGLRVRMKYLVSYYINQEPADRYKHSKEIKIGILEKELFDLERNISLMKVTDEQYDDIDYLENILQSSTQYNDFDVNFDGFEDFTIDCKVCGCANCNFTYVYLFDPKEKKFKESKYLSNNVMLELDTVNRTVTCLFRGDARNLFYRLEKYRKNGTMEYAETYSMETLKNKKGEEIKYKFIYNKRIKNKVVKSKTEYSDFEREDFPKWWGDFTQH